MLAVSTQQLRHDGGDSFFEADQLFHSSYHWQTLWGLRGYCGAVTLTPKLVKPSHATIRRLRRLPPLVWFAVEGLGY